MRIRISGFARTLLLSVAMTGVSMGGVIDWSMTLSPQFTQGTSNEKIDLLITFSNNSKQDIIFSDFGDGQGITVDLEGNVAGNGACGPGDDCFVQNLFSTSPDPIDIPAGSTGTTFDLGYLRLGMHNAGDQIIVVTKGGPDSFNGTFPNPAFSETTALVQVVPEPSTKALLIAILLGTGLVTGARRTAAGSAGQEHKRLGLENIPFSAHIKREQGQLRRPCGLPTQPALQYNFIAKVGPNDTTSLRRPNPRRPLVPGPDLCLPRGRRPQ